MVISISQFDCDGKKFCSHGFGHFFYALRVINKFRTQRSGLMIGGTSDRSVVGIAAYVLYEKNQKLQKVDNRELQDA